MTPPRIPTQIARCLCLLLLAALTGCASQKAAAKSPKGKLLQEAEHYASDLKAQDKLPGYGSAEHGRVIASAAWKGGEVTYPVTVTVRAWKQSDDTTYCYDLVKDTADSPWQLTKATQLDKHDHLLKQLSPK